MTSRQHQLIMSLYQRCDEINQELESIDYKDPRYTALMGGHTELVLLADKLRCQFEAEAKALKEINFLSSKVNINA